jgi:hypothetical protein
MPIPAENIWYDLSWKDLITQINRVINMDLTRMEKNSRYLIDLSKKEIRDFEKIESLKQKIQFEKLRTDLIIEILNRLQTHNVLLYVTALDQFFESEGFNWDQLPENYQLIITKIESYFKIYYNPL